MWSDFKLALAHLGRSALTKIDYQYVLFLIPVVLSDQICRMSQMPRFRNLHHFKEVTHITFNDGSKFEALSKVSLEIFYKLHVLKSTAIFFCRA